MQLIKSAKLIVLVALAALLAGCGEHGYEGVYETKTSSSNAFINVVADAAGSQQIVIGTDYIEVQGERQDFEDIFVRETGSDKYLVLKDEDFEEAWKIIDKDTLLSDTGLATVKLVRVN